MKLWRITFTGADNNTDFKRMEELSEEYPKIEWGILFSKSKSGVERYPDEDSIRKICNLKAQRSAHLCGAWVKDVIKGEFTFEKSEFFRYFERIQLNFAKSALKKFIDVDMSFLGLNRRIILGGNFSKIPINFRENPNVRGKAILFDASGGHGKSPKSWSDAFDGFSCGYAGGLNPDNLEENLFALEKVGNRHIWIDMESGVRTDGQFDLDKVEKCLQIASPWLKPEKRVKK